MSLRPRRIRIRVFLAATLIAAALLASIVVVPQWLSKQARLEVLRAHVGQVAGLAASAVDGDLHRQLLDATRFTPELYAAALRPLVRFHSADKDIFYVYTMVAKDRDTYFVLDTATSSELQSKHKLEPSPYMSRFQLRKEYESDWLQQIASGHTWVTPTFQKDDYGNFLTAHAPIYDSQGRYSGFAGVDFDLEYYLAQEARFRTIAIESLAAALLAALLIGYFVARYQFDMQHRIEEHYYTSVRDALTGLLNRRGVMDAIGKALAHRRASYATLLVDVDDLKKVNDTHGHAAGDAVITHVAQAIRRSIRAGDECARLGGDEFMVFAAACDVAAATELAERILAEVVGDGAIEVLAADDSRIRVAVSVSIGVAVRENHDADFDHLYREADAALYRAKSAGRQRLAIYAAPIRVVGA